MIAIDILNLNKHIKYKLCDKNEETKKEKRKYSKKLAYYNTRSPKLKGYEEIRRDPDNYTLIQVKCTESTCRKWFNPTNVQCSHRISAIDGKGTGEGRFYCSDGCKQKCSIFRQRKYPKDFKHNYSREVQPELREMVLERDDYICQKCGSKDNLECHHFDGIMWEPLLSADIDECITFCNICHLEAHQDIGCRQIDLAC